MNGTMKKWASMSTIISLQDLQIFTLPLCKTDTGLPYTNLSTPSTVWKLVFTWRKTQKCLIKVFKVQATIKLESSVGICFQKRATHSVQKQILTLLISEKVKIKLHKVCDFS